jgi:chemotaxis protein MotB
VEVSRRRGRATPVSHERWLVSYADFVTLLFAFFVVLYASAQVDRQRALQLSQAIRSGFQQLGAFGTGRPDISGGRAMRTSVDSKNQIDFSGSEDVDNASNSGAMPADFASIRSELEQALAAEIGRNEVTLHAGADGLVVTLREIGFFDSGSASIKPGAEKAFARVAAILRAHSCELRIEGHTDNVPIHTAQFASNWELSTARASGLVRSLVDVYGVSPALLSAAGYAEFHPAASNETSQGRALNRRVDLVILKSAPKTPARGLSQSHVRHGQPSANPAPAADNLATLRRRPVPARMGLQPGP